MDSQVKLQMVIGNTVVEIDRDTFVSSSIPSLRKWLFYSRENRLPWANFLKQISVERLGLGEEELVSLNAAKVLVDLYQGYKDLIDKIDKAFVPLMSQICGRLEQIESLLGAGTSSARPASGHPQPTSSNRPNVTLPLQTEDQLWKVEKLLAEGHFIKDWVH